MGLRGASVRVERRLDGTLAVRHGERYLPVHECAVADTKVVAAQPERHGKAARRTQRRGSDWNQKFDLKKGPKVWQAALIG